MNTSQSNDDATSAEPEKDFGPRLVRAIAADEKAWTLDLLLDRNPREHTLSDHDLMQGIRLLRAERTAIEVKQERAKARKDGVNDDDTDDADTNA